MSIEINNQPRLPSPQQTASPATPLPTSGAVPMARTDEDIIDATWAHRVEAAIHTYRNDPRALASHIAGLRAEYQQARFGKAPLRADER